MTPTRDRLITAARELFRRQGYGATAIVQILREADANSGSLYHYFPGKEDLLLGVLRWYRANLRRLVIEPAIEHESDPIERVFCILAAYRMMLEETRCTLGCPIGNLALELPGASGPVHELIVENFDAWKRCVHECLCEAIDRLPHGADLESLASFLLTVMEGAVMQARAYGAIAPFDEAVAQLRNYFDLLRARDRTGDGRSS